MITRPPLVDMFIRGDKLSGKMSKEVINYLYSLEKSNKELLQIITGIKGIKDGKTI